MIKFKNLSEQFYFNNCLDYEEWDKLKIFDFKKILNIINNQFYN